VKHKGVKLSMESALVQLCLVQRGKFKPSGMSDSFVRRIEQKATSC